MTRLGALLAVGAMMTVSFDAVAGTLHLKYGYSVEAEDWWDGPAGMLFYSKGGVTRGVPKTDVTRIEGAPRGASPVDATKLREELLAADRRAECLSRTVVTPGDVANMETSIDILTGLGAQFLPVQQRLRAHLGLQRRALRGDADAIAELAARCSP